MYYIYFVLILYFCPHTCLHIILPRFHVISFGHLFSFLYGRDDLNIEEKYVVRMSLYAPPLHHFCFPLLPSNLSSHLLTQLATSYMRCKELYGSNVPHLVIPHDRRSCKGLRRSNVLLRGYQQLSVCTPPEYIRAPAGPARRASLAVQFQPTRHRAVPLHHQTPLCSFLS
jgi:hypothetical protein